MSIKFKPSRTTLSAFEVRNALPESSATFVVGAPLQRDNTNTDEIEEHAGGATVTGIIGVAGAPVTSGTPEFRSDALYYAANQQTEFVGQVISSGTVQTISTTPGTYEGNEYGMVKSGSDWYVDAADITNVHLTVTKEMPEINAVLFKFLATAISD